MGKGLDQHAQSPHAPLGNSAEGAWSIAARHAIHASRSRSPAEAADTICDPCWQRPGPEVAGTVQVRQDLRIDEKEDEAERSGEGHHDSSAGAA